MQWGKMYQSDNDMTTGFKVFSKSAAALSRFITW